MSDFLLELRSEEIPARMQKGARGELEKLFRRAMDAAGVSIGEITVYSTPRRLALIARDLPQETEAVSEEAKGPPEGAPDQAIDGFCRKNGVTRDQLEVRDVKGRNTYFAVINRPGRAVTGVLAEAIPAIIRDFSWPKSQRWGAASISTESLRWVRPLSGIVALLGNEIVECEVHGVTSGAVTLGHRFHHSGDITIGGADDYAMKLRVAHVIVGHEERQDIIRTGAAKAAQDAGLSLVEDEGLVIENAGLTEWPVPLLGRFEDDFLEVPPETIQLTARVNQKYFVCEDSAGKLANAFICTANIEAEDPGVVVEGNRRVLAARLSDAKFFWDVDRKKTLAQHAEGLARITFHEKLGTVADKVERVAKLAEWLASEGIVPDCDPAFTRQAAELCKADLVTEMVGEFPELQGLMGGYYARAEGLPDAVADAIRDHYKPVGPSDNVPTFPVTIAVSLADKLDTVFQMFSIQAEPTGSKDPFALRRAAIGINNILTTNNVKLNFNDALVVNGANYTQHIKTWSPEFGEKAKAIEDSFSEQVSDYKDPAMRMALALQLHLAAALWQFFGFRMISQLKSEGKRPDYIEAVLYSNAHDIPSMIARANALQAFMESDDGANLLAGYKRAANILKKEDWSDEQKNSLSYTPEPAEKALIDALDAAEPKAAASIESEDFGAAMAALASLRAPIDVFFEDVTVNDDDQDKRAARLGLLLRFRNAVHTVADFARIEG